MVWNYCYVFHCPSLVFIPLTVSIAWSLGTELEERKYEFLFQQQTYACTLLHVSVTWMSLIQGRTHSRAFCFADLLVYLETRFHALGDSRFFRSHCQSLWEFVKGCIGKFLGMWCDRSQNPNLVCLLIIVFFISSVIFTFPLEVCMKVVGPGSSLR